jgi:hypothetical protein
MASGLNQIQPGPGRWGNVSEFVRPYMDVLHTMADAELSSDKVIYNFWDRYQARDKPPAPIIVHRVAEEVRKIAYREGWWACGDQYPTQAIAWRICQDWQEERGP